MKPRYHIVWSLVISSVFYHIYASGLAFVVSLCAGIFIDVDHFLDYFLQEKVTLRVDKVFCWCAERRFKHMLILLHSLELVILIWVFIYVFQLNLLWVALALGLTQHLVLDMIFNGKVVYSHAYFLTYRVVHRFKKERLLRPEYLFLEKG
ncbi:MAG: hypothetical protein KBA46_05495 [Candidatus Omnitrophica bacterium]|nr:hypothetical protein [Candidatus Omnitrophota bacterium]